MNSHLHNLYAEQATLANKLEQECQEFIDTQRSLRSAKVGSEEAADLMGLVLARAAQLKMTADDLQVISDRIDDLEFALDTEAA
jgi:predicted house-cleaning noncanonical NTP pyrophosphatase (MazG superfamily)